MATNFPTSLDSFTNPTSTDTLASPDHAGQHTNINDAVKALETKVGVDGSAVTTTLDYKVGQRALTSEPFVTVGNSSGLSAERALTAGAGITITDGGADSTVTVSGYVSTTATGCWLYPLGNSITTWPGGPTGPNVYFVPVHVFNKQTFDRIAVNVNTAAASSTLVSLAIYGETNGKPGNLILNAGTVDVSGATGVRTITISQQLTPGRYWLAANYPTSTTGAFVMQTVSGGLTEFGGSVGTTFLSSIGYAYAISGSTLPSTVTGHILSIRAFWIGLRAA